MGDPPAFGVFENVCAGVSFRQFAFKTAGILSHPPEFYQQIAFRLTVRASRRQNVQQRRYVADADRSVFVKIRAGQLIGRSFGQGV